MSEKIWRGMRYHFASAEIQCNADKEGAEVFEMVIRGDSVIEKRLVLSHDEKLAKEAAIRHHIDYCSMCNSVLCQCRYEDQEDD